MTNSKIVYLVRYVMTDQQNDHVIGVFTDKGKAIEAARKFKQCLGSWDHTQVEAIQLNVYMDEDYDEDDELYYEVF